MNNPWSFFLDTFYSMNISNSSFPASHEQGNQTKPFSSFILQPYILAALISVTLLLLLICLLVCHFRTKYSRRKLRTIQRQGVIIKKHLQPAGDQSQPALLEPYPAQGVDHILVPHDTLISNRNLEPKITDTSCSTEGFSTSSITNQLSNERNDNDDLSDLDLTNIPLRRLKLLHLAAADTSVLQVNKRSSDSSSDNLYIRQFKEQAPAATKQRCNPRVSTGSKSSDGSCF